MRTIHTLALLALLLSPLAATSADLTFQVDGQVEYDSNALRQNGEEEDDVLFRAVPEVRLHEDRGQDLTYSLSYAVPFEFAVENGDELDDIDHKARGRLNYRPNDRISMYLEDDFRYLRGALRSVGVEEAIAGEGTLLINEERDRVTLNSAGGGMTYRFTPRVIGVLSLAHELYESDRPDRADNWLLSGSGAMEYVLTPKHSLGLGAAYYHQDFDDRSSIPGSTVDSYNVFGQWVYRISETLQFSIKAGPTLIESEQDDPPPAVTVPAIPSLALAGGTLLDGLGLVNPDGTPATGLAENNSRVVSQVDACPTLDDGMTQVFAGTICPLPGAGAPATTQGIYIDGTTPLATAVAQTTTLATDPFAEGQSETSWSVFGEAVIAKHWTDNLHSALRYSRSQGGASGLGGAVIRDAVNLSNTWDFAERWQLALRGDWTLRQSITDSGVSQFRVAQDASAFDPAFTATSPAGGMQLVTIEGGNTNEIDTMRWGVAGRLTHRFTRNTSGWLQLTYNEQTSDTGTLGDPSDFEDFLAVLGVRHVFDPIKLW